MGQEPREDDPMSQSWIESITTMLAAIDDEFIQACSISIVADKLKKSNENAYMPKVVSIGPLNRGTKRDLLYMEEIKLRCMLSLFHRAANVKERVKECCKVILSLDKVVRASYVNEIKLDSYELARIMLLDGCFLLELLLITGSQEEMKMKDIPKSRLEPPGPGADICKNEDILSDLTMLENQIPIVILHKLSTVLFPDVFTNTKEDRIKQINELALSLLGYPPVSNPDASHFLELVHSSILCNGKKEEQSLGQSKILSESSGHGKKVEEIQDSQHSSIVVKSEQVEESTRPELKLERCVTRLQAAGITIKPPDSNSEPSDRQGNCFGRMLMGTGEESKHVKKHAVKGSRFDLNIRFNEREGKLEIPPLHITETTKTKWLNFIAWEHNRKNWKTYCTAGDQGTTGLNFKFTSSALFFNGLICCEADVQLLKDSKVIVDHSKMSNKELMNIFRTISMGVDDSIVDSIYIKMCERLNKYSAVNCAIKIPIIWWHNFIGFLEWLYNLCKCHFDFFVNFMKRDYNSVATVIPILTFAQTIFAVLSYFNDKK